MHFSADNGVNGNELWQLKDLEYVAPTYNVALSSSNIDQGEGFGATITTTNIVPGTYLYYQLTDITSDDVIDPSQRYGYVQIGADGTVTKENAYNRRNTNF